MAFRKLANEAASNLENMVRVHEDQGFCCADAAKDVVTYSSASQDIGTTGIKAIEIDGTTYNFDATATTQADLVEETNKAFAAAFYTEVGGTAVSVSGALAATVVTIETTATLTNYIDANDANVAFS